MRTKSEKPSQNIIKTVVKLYLVPLIIFSVFRLVLFLTETNRISISEDGILNIFKAFIMGVRFDIVISGYILLLPVLVLFIMDILNIRKNAIIKSVFIFIFLLFSVSFLICAADIPYFNQFFSRFTITAFEWMDSPTFVFKMIIQEPKYFLFSVPAIVTIIIFFKILRNTLHNYKPSSLKFFIKIPLYILILGVMFLGIRGRIAHKSPIRVGTAYFCNNAFLNQLGLNPVFTLMKSYLNSKSDRNKSIDLIDSKLAEENVSRYLKIEELKYNSPIARDVTFDTLLEKKPNVVLVIMESMGASKMKRHGNTNNLTPFLDSLSYQSIYFENVYTAGIHTFNGVFGTIFSYPAIFRRHPMKQMRKYNGLATTLKKYDYQNIYFTTHDGQFDNVEGFLINNDFDRVVSQKDYPSSKVISALGVPDDYMFAHSIPILNELSKNEKPFLSVYMTASDHGPWYVPEYYSPSASDVKEQTVQYADWSLKSFIEESSKQEWFNNTIFVFIADHGLPLKVTYDIPLEYYHSPLLFYAPSIIDSTYSVSKIGGQIDVFPTLMGLLKLPYTNNTMGIDLLKNDREYIIINNDDKVGVLDSAFFLIMKQDEKSKLYKYRNLDKKNYAEMYSEKVHQMEVFTKSNLQVVQDMINNNQTYIEAAPTKQTKTPNP